jgi:hypothetical protein
MTYGNPFVLILKKAVQFNCRWLRQGKARGTGAFVLGSVWYQSPDKLRHLVAAVALHLAGD